MGVAPEKYKYITKGDKVRIELFSEDEQQKPKEVTALRVYPESMIGALLVDDEGGIHLLDKAESIEVLEYSGNIPNARHIYWQHAYRKPNDVLDYRNKYAHRIGHPGNRVWEHEGTAYSEDELRKIIGSEQARALDERY